MGPRIRITLRLLGFALLIFAGVRFVIDVASSFHSEGSISRTNRGYQIDQFIEIDHWTILAGLSPKNKEVPENRGLSTEEQT